MPGMVHDVSQQQAFDQACAWAEVFGLESAAKRSIILERPMGNSRARAVICFAAQLQPPTGAAFVKVSEVRDAIAREASAAALAQVMRMKGEVDVSGLPVSGWESGRVSGTAAYHPEPSQRSVPQEFYSELQKHKRAQGKLEAHLDADASQYMLDWKARLSPFHLDDISDCLKQPLIDLDWCGILLPDPHTPVETERSSLPQQQELPRRPAPNGWLSAVRPIYRVEARRRVKSFAKKMTLWLQGAADRPSVVVIPGSWLEHWVFEAPHDFTVEPGWAVPIDVSTASPSHLDPDFFRDWGECYPDQELVSFLLLGVRYKADLPVQIVLQPHLKSFLPVQEKYLAEADRFVARGWTVCCEQIPVVPYFSASCGSVARPLEPDRPRCTNDAGAPRSEVFDDDGVRVMPLNEAILGSTWPKEVKPNALQVCTIMRILLEAAQCLGETVFMITDDYASFFNQMRLSPSEYAKSGAVHPPRPGQKQVTFAYDTVLGFGIKMASNVAQRFANFLVHILKQKLKPVMQSLAKKLCGGNSRFAQWWSHRCSLGEDQAVISAMLMYCDDPCILCVGADMTYEALKAWHWLSKSSNTMMAIPEKRTLGISAKWIGIRFFSALGIAVVPSQKVLWACGLMDAAMSSSLSVDQYRSLVGFLEHVRSVLFLKGDKMYGLYEPLSWNLEPIEAVHCTTLMWKQMARMRHRLMVQAGVSVIHLRAFLSGVQLPKVQHSIATRRFAAFSDAAKEGTDRPGLGGWFCGYCWRIPLSAEHLELHITILEAIAAVVNMCAVHRVLGGVDHLPADSCIECHVDAKSTADILIKGRAKSEMLVHLHTMALQLEAFVSLLPFTIVLHCLGLGNLASDACSRGYDDVLHVIAACLEMRMIPVDLTQIGLQLLDRCLLKQREIGRRQHEYCWGRRGEVIGQARVPGPDSFIPFKRRRVQREPEMLSKGQQGKCASSFQQHKRARVQDVPSAPPSATSFGRYNVPVSSRLSAARPQLVGQVTPHSLASELWQDQSGFAICTGNWQQLLTSCEVALCTAGDAFSLRTAQQDVYNWTAWTGYCDTMNTNPLRPPVDPVNDRVGYLREVVLLTNALTFFMRTRKGKSYAMIKPQSAMNILLGANRVLRQQHLSFIPLKALALPLKGLMRKFVLTFGPVSLVPKRREPFTNGMIDSLVSLPAGSSLGSIGKFDCLSILGKSWIAAVAVSTSAGFRKAEMFQSNAETFYLMWSLISWNFGGCPDGSVADPSDEQLMALKEGDYLVITPPPSKSDQFNMAWGSHPIYIAFHNQVRNAARAVAALALAVAKDRRRPTRAVFVTDNKQPLQARHMASAMHHAVAQLVGSARAKLFTWHSGRIYLCTALHAAGVKPSVTQAMLRWRTDESMFNIRRTLIYKLSCCLI